MLAPLLEKNDKRAKTVIGLVSVVVFLAVVALDKHIIPTPPTLPFDVHVFAFINSVINSMVSVLLLLGLFTAKNRNFILHKKIMFAAMFLSVLFLLSYICHHLWAGDTHYGGEGLIKYIYFFLLTTHIILAAVILPFILFTAYRALTSEFPKHKKMAKYTWPLWFYVSVTGVIVYWMIQPYYA